ncbi:hypothetical protein JCM24511_07064 [Saitozyma sp. JCM 24511]|nr:hypothetical protein JCM24511_07064 [Saitozyma sp. JCM 24511]
MASLTRASRALSTLVQVRSVPREFSSFLGSIMADSDHPTLHLDGTNIRNLIRLRRGDTSSPNMTVGPLLVWRIKAPASGQASMFALPARLEVVSEDGSSRADADSAKSNDSSWSFTFNPVSLPADTTPMPLTRQGELDAFGTAGATEVTASIGPMSRGALNRMIRSAMGSDAESEGSRAYTAAVSKEDLADVESFVNDGTPERMSGAVP